MWQKNGALVCGQPLGRRRKSSKRILDLHPSVTLLEQNSLTCLDFSKYDDITVLQDLFPAIFAYLFRDDKLLEAKIEPTTKYEVTACGVSVIKGIISGGINVYPRDIEEVIIKHPSVRDVAVYGVPSEKWGETPVAAVVLRKDAAAAPREILAWVNERVEARFQKVKDVVVLDEFPRTATGKILKRILRDM